MQYVFHPSEEYSFEKDGHKGKIFDTRALSDRVEFSLIETEKGNEAKIMEKECIFSYFILEGTGEFEIDGTRAECGQGDLVVVPNGLPFRYTGRMKMLLISTPWWFPEQEETL
jgi:mannose-6-phosphate isomerase-like protein (cupin superfamily)